MTLEYKIQPQIQKELEKQICQIRYTMTHPKLQKNPKIQSKLLEHLGQKRMDLCSINMNRKTARLGINAYFAARKLKEQYQATTII